MILTNDLIIRSALKKKLENHHAKDKKVRIIEELGIRHGTVRIDFAVVNGIMHGYEIKSDRDTLQRLPEQMNEYNAVFDKLTLVVGKRHLYDAINLVPDWWGIMTAKIDTNNEIIFHTIREADDNRNQVGVSIARLLWREEALQILEEYDQAGGVRSKPREFVYKRLADVLETDMLKEKVRETLLVSRGDWRFGLLPILNGG
ncbi:MAG: hypothetical protein A2042_05395 [Candidatus Schekmanbacteria bacterium GWA2_38_11]|uniref:Sce7726 family protein n=1 Tax=Candidatus Schekmanbacteria bacterium GWA2_38_11 TaxID=1817876 RepID=A0A1F7R9D8_9BACT|nr:MAG: hypothetical protein A2042_05395 [Candidatus Schekmanbacteria bacterium GWA2_38_11]OGU55288.1 MAG: hypothetical protein A2006_10960 [Ignavibacteria bacterium GWC2_35_8]